MIDDELNEDELDEEAVVPAETEEEDAPFGFGGEDELNEEPSQTKEMDIHGFNEDASEL